MLFLKTNVLKLVSLIVCFDKYGTNGPIWKIFVSVNPAIEESITLQYIYKQKQNKKSSAVSMRNVVKAGKNIPLDSF